MAFKPELYCLRGSGSKTGRGSGASRPEVDCSKTQFSTAAVANSERPLPALTEYNLPKRSGDPTNFVVFG
eukprot:scaffold495_cov243-Pinguiococcus_pyrenoidosus.AAC.12